MEKQNKTDILAELLKIDPNFLTYTAENKKQQRKDEILKYLKEYFAENGNLDVSQSYKHPIRDENGKFEKEENGEIKTFFLGSAISKLKNKISKDREDKEFLKLIKEIDPNFPYTKKSKDDERKELTLKCLKEYFAENGNLDVTSTYKHPLHDKNGNFMKDENGEFKSFFLGSAISNLKNEISKGREDKEFLKLIKEIDPNFPYFREEKRTKDEELMLKCLREYYDMYHNLAVPNKGYTHITFDDDENLVFYPLSQNFGQVLFNVRKEKKGEKPQRNYSERFLKEVQQLDPAAFEDGHGYRRMVRSEESKNRMDLTPEEKLVVRLVKEFATTNGNTRIKKGYKHLVTDENGKPLKDENGENIYVNLSTIMLNIKSYIRGHGSDTFPKGMIEALEEIDPDIFKKRFTKEKIVEEEKVVEDEKFDKKISAGQESDNSSKAENSGSELPEQTDSVVAAGSKPKVRKEDEVCQHHQQFDGNFERVHKRNPFDREM